MAEHDPVVDAFARFRQDVRAEIHLPGADAARQAGRRHRLVHAGWAAGGVAVLAVGLFATVGPTVIVTDAQLEQLSSDAADALPDAPEYDKVYHTAVTARTQDETYRFAVGSSPRQFTTGTAYSLIAVCRGRGTVTLSWQVPGNVTGTAAVVCGGSTLHLTITPKADGQYIYVRLMPDQAAVGRAGIAVGVTEFA